MIVTESLIISNAGIFSPVRRDAAGACTAGRRCDPSRPARAAAPADCTTTRLAVVELHQRRGVVRIRLRVNDPRRLGEGQLVGDDLLRRSAGARSRSVESRCARLKGRKTQGPSRQVLSAAQSVGDAAHVAQSPNRLARARAAGRSRQCASRPCRKPTRSALQSSRIERRTLSLQ